MRFLREASAIARKEILFDFRFGIQFILQSVTSPFSRLIPIIILYMAILSGEQQSPISGIDGVTYVPFLLIGILFQSMWSSGTSVFQDKFMREKYMQTVDLLFIAPIRITSIILGYGISAIIHSSPSILVFITMATIVRPPSISGFFLSIIPLIFVFGIALSIGLIYGGAKLANEDIAPLFTYSITGISFATIFVYPIEIFNELPGILGIIIPILARINPLNAGLLFARAAWFGESLPWLSLIYLTVITAILSISSMSIFRYTWRRFGVQG